MTPTLESETRNMLAAPLPANSDKRLCHLQQTQPEFTGRGAACISSSMKSKKNFIWLTSIFITVVLVFSTAALAVQTEPKTSQPKDQTSSNVDTLVFCPQPFQTALKPWLDYRRQQGHRIQVLAPSATAVELKQQISTVADKHKLAHLVLIGDAYDRKADSKLLVPTEYVLSRATFKMGAEPDIATDNPFADLDGDGVPDITVGRIPVDSANELTQFIERVIAYELGTTSHDRLDVADAT